MLLHVNNDSNYSNYHDVSLLHIPAVLERDRLLSFENSYDSTIPE